MRVAVLGSNSFAAQDFQDLLAESGRFELLGISRSAVKSSEFKELRYDRPQFRFLQADLNTDLDRIVETIQSFSPHYVVNFAAQGDDTASWSHPRDFIETNCVALSGLLDALKHETYIERFLQVSSSSVYGNPDTLVTEHSPLAPESPYGVSKAAADMLLLAYWRNFNFPVQIVRPPNLYGCGQPLFRIIPKTIIALRTNQVIELHGGGKAMRPYLHIRDASRAMLAMLEHAPAGSVYNISPNDPIRVCDLVALICDLLGKEFTASTRIVADRRGQASVSGFGSTKIRDELGWEPQISLRRGIRGMIDWIEREWNQMIDSRVTYTHIR